MRCSLLLVILLCPSCANPRSAGPQQTVPTAEQPVAAAASAQPNTAASTEPPNTAASAAAPSASAASDWRSKAGVPHRRMQGSPGWTQIDGVGACTGKILSNYACTPGQRPSRCGGKAWQALTALSDGEELTPCGLEPDITDCTVPIPDDAAARCYPAQRPAKCSDEKWERVKGNKLVYDCANQ